MSVRFAILGLLAQRPRHGYELRAAFEALAGGAESWDVKPAQVYTTLDRLEEAGLVVQEGLAQDAGPEKRIYALTDNGQEALLEWFDNGVASEPQRDEFFIKLMVSLASGQGQPAQIIQTQRRALYRELHAITAQRDERDASVELAQILLMDKAIMHLEADLRWLDFVEARLDEIQKQPLPQPETRPRGRPRKVAQES